MELAQGSPPVQAMSPLGNVLTPPHSGTLTFLAIALCVTIVGAIGTIDTLPGILQTK